MDMLETKSPPPTPRRRIKKKYEFPTREFYFHTIKKYSNQNTWWSKHPVHRYLLGMDTLATNSPPNPPKGDKENMWISDNGIGSSWDADSYASHRIFSKINDFWVIRIFQLWTLFRQSQMGHNYWIRSDRVTRPWHNTLHSAKSGAGV